MSEIPEHLTDRIKNLHLDLARLEHSLKTDDGAGGQLHMLVAGLTTEAADNMRLAYYVVR